MPNEVLLETRSLIDRGRSWHEEWQREFTTWRAKWPERAALLDRLLSHDLPSGWEEDLPRFEVGKKIATRKASGDVIQSLASRLPELWGGSADLAESNNTLIHDASSFLPAGSAMKNATPYGRNIHFGIREHAMGAIANGIALYGLSRIYVGTFLVFSDYMRGSVRLSALMKLPVTYVFTHDSIGLGEDGPTHQPIEHAAALRAIPQLSVIRPADANEVALAWRHLIKNPQPAALLLSRQNLPVLDIDPSAMSAGLARGAYVVSEVSDPNAIIIATGSELNLAIDAAKELADDGIHVRVVSAPSLEWFAAQPQEYRDAVLPPKVKARVSVEAGISQSWHRWIGDAGVSLSIENFGASASAEVLFREFGFTVENVKEAVKASIAKA